MLLVCGKRQPHLLTISPKLEVFLRKSISSNRTNSSQLPTRTTPNQSLKTMSQLKLTARMTGLIHWLVIYTRISTLREYTKLSLKGMKGLWMLVESSWVGIVKYTHLHYKHSTTAQNYQSISNNTIISPCLWRQKKLTRQNQMTGLGIWWLSSLTISRS